MTQRHEDSDDDTYVTLGSAFEKLETVEDVEKAKRKKEKEQYVTDEQGRRRFHGAFTGGFSAGYYNTVGSKEGWTPSSFMSSKVKKAVRSSQRPEDFMDDEDLGEFGIAPRAITARDTFNKKEEEGVGLKRQTDFQAVIPGEPPLQNLVVPAHSTIGAKLLKSMGWKEGQGVGPKIIKYSTEKDKGKLGSKKVYGCAMPGQVEDGGAVVIPKEAEGFLFAPSDVTPWEVEGKDDSHGIGYSGIAEQKVLGSRKTTKALYGMSGEAFGTGALDEEDEEEEEDVYGVETITSYDRTLASERDIAEERKFGWTGGLQDGWSLASFMKASKHTTNTKKHPPPDVPRDFVCRHAFKSSSSVPSSAGDTAKKPLTSRERSQLLSDKPESVFDLLSHSDRERLKTARGTTRSAVETPPTSTHTSQEAAPPPLTLPHPAKSSPAAVAAASASAAPQARLDIKSFQASEMKPFSRDPAKQARYEAHLEGKAMPAADSGMTEWERQKEQEDFVRAARVFRPLTSSLSSRFTRGDDDETDRRKSDKQPERPLTPESDAVQAAKANMFGVLTHEVQDWHPHRLICKRFNIPDPYPNSSLLGVATEKEKRKKIFGDTSRSINFLHTERIVSTVSQQEQEEGGGGGGGREEAGRGLSMDSRGRTGAKERSDEKASRDMQAKREDDNTSKDEPQTAEEVVEERPPMDLFKAIFADSSSEDDSSEETEHEETQDKHSTISSSTSNHRKWQDLSTITQSVPSPDNQSRRLIAEEKSRLSRGPVHDNTDHHNIRDKHFGNTPPNSNAKQSSDRAGDVIVAQKKERHDGRTNFNERDSTSKTKEKHAETVEAAFGPSLPPEDDIPVIPMDFKEEKEESKHERKKDRSPHRHHKTKKHKHTKEHKKHKHSRDH